MTTGPTRVSCKHCTRRGLWWVEVTLGMDNLGPFCWAHGKLASQRWDGRLFTVRPAYGREPHGSQLPVE
jgi:hypothetical protein